MSLPGSEVIMKKFPWYKRLWWWFRRFFKPKPVSMVTSGWSEPVDSTPEPWEPKKRHFRVQARGSKTNITKGAFGTCHYRSQDR